MTTLSTVDHSEALQELKELAEFVGHSNPQVRVQAAQMVTSLSALESNRVLIAQTSLVPKLAAQMTDSKEIAREVYKALINFAESEELCRQMMRANHISIAMEVLRDPKTSLELRELLLMFLVNLTRLEDGARVLLQEGEEVEGLHVRRLFSWMVDSAGASTQDPNAYCAHILTNVSQVPAGRRLLLDRQRGLLRHVQAQLRSASATRRTGCLQLLKNCFMEESAQLYLLSDELGLAPWILTPLIGHEPFLHGEQEYEGIWPEVRRQMQPNKQRDPDPQVRVLVYEILLLCARHGPARRFLKDRAIYPLLRHAHDAEKAEPDDPACCELDQLCEQLVPFFVLDEDDESHPERKGQAERQRRVAQLREINEQEAAEISRKAQDKAAQVEQKKEEQKKETQAPVAEAKAEAEEEEVVYLDDALGDTGLSAASLAMQDADPARVAAARAAEAAALASKADLEEDFPDVQPFGAEETEQLGELTHNLKSLELLREEEKAKQQAASQQQQKAQPVYAQAAPEEDDDDDDDGPPPLADEESYMDGMD